jgi:hypothetical protein
MGTGAISVRSMPGDPIPAFSTDRSACPPTHIQTQGFNRGLRGYRRRSVGTLTLVLACGTTQESRAIAIANARRNGELMNVLSTLDNRLHLRLLVALGRRYAALRDRLGSVGISIVRATCHRSMMYASKLLLITSRTLACSGNELTNI